MVLSEWCYTSGWPVSPRKGLEPACQWRETQCCVSRLRWSQGSPRRLLAAARDRLPPRAPATLLDFAPSGTDPNAGSDARPACSNRANACHRPSRGYTVGNKSRSPTPCHNTLASIRRRTHQRVVILARITAGVQFLTPSDSHVIAMISALFIPIDFGSKDLVGPPTNKASLGVTLHDC